MIEWSSAIAIALVALVAFVWWMQRRGRNRRLAEFDAGMARSAEKWEEKHT